MLELLTDGKTILNIDESWISETEYGRRMWCPTASADTIPDNQIIPRLALIAALDTEGHVYYALTHAITNGDVLLLFWAI